MYDVAIRGSGPAALYCALTLAPHAKTVLTARETSEDTGVTWPGFTEHWGFSKTALVSTKPPP